MVVGKMYVRVSVQHKAQYILALPVKPDVDIATLPVLRFGIHQCVPLPFQYTASVACLPEVFRQFHAIAVGTAVLLFYETRIHVPRQETVRIGPLVLWQLLDSRVGHAENSLLVAELIQLIPLLVRQAGIHAVCPVQRHCYQLYCLIYHISP